MGSELGSGIDKFMLRVWYYLFLIFFCRFSFFVVRSEVLTPVTVENDSSRT